MFSKQKLFFAVFFFKKNEMQVQLTILTLKYQNLE